MSRSAARAGGSDTAGWESSPRRWTTSGVVSYRLRCGRENEGGLNVAHGGWTAGVLDELVGHVAMLNDQLAVTGQLNVTFVKPVPVEQQLTAQAWSARKEGSRWFVTAVLSLEASGAELARAEAILVERDSGHFARHRAWLRGQLAEPDLIREGMSVAETTFGGHSGSTVGSSPTASPSSTARDG